ncbi:unnamed protein product [Adineta steineri]|uniref:FAD-binding domain-containing protein n=3 Tax=Adineta steineri TaxID=433720 RepID=A0A814VTN8_9BILA|nr:unnamed protein product [Adineta steineri]
MDDVIYHHDLLQQQLNEQDTTSSQHPLMMEINNWEHESVEKIRLTAEKARCDLDQLLTSNKKLVIKQLEEISTQLKTSKEADDYSEKNLTGWLQALEKLKNQLSSPSDVKLQKTNDEIWLRSSEKFEKVCGKVQILENGLVAEHNGTASTAEVRVADGMHSSVRRYMFPDIKLNFHKHILLTGITPLNEGEQLPDQICPLLFGTTGQGVSVFLAPIDEKSFFWSLSYHSEQPRSPPLIGSAMSKDEQENLINEIVARSMNCLSDEFRSFVKRCDRQRLLIINCYDKFPHQNPSEKHIIFIGDALHPMSPMGGNGANMAIRDGVDFVETLIKNYGTNNGNVIEQSIKEFDRCHTKRSVNAIKISHRNISTAESTGLKFYANILIMKILVFVMTNRVLFKRSLFSLAICAVVIIFLLFL